MFNITFKGKSMLTWEFYGQISLFCVINVLARWPHGYCAIDSEASGPGSSPGRGPCVGFLDKTLYSHGASLHPGV